MSESVIEYLEMSSHATDIEMKVHISCTFMDEKLSTEICGYHTCQPSHHCQSRVESKLHLQPAFHNATEMA